MFDKFSRRLAQRFRNLATAQSEADAKETKEALDDEAAIIIMGLLQRRFEVASFKERPITTFRKHCPHPFAVEVTWISLPQTHVVLQVKAQEVFQNIARFRLR